MNKAMDQIIPLQFPKNEGKRINTKRIQKDLKGECYYVIEDNSYYECVPEIHPLTMCFTFKAIDPEGLITMRRFFVKEEDADRMLNIVSSSDFDKQAIYNIKNIPKNTEYYNYLIEDNIGDSDTYPALSVLEECLIFRPSSAYPYLTKYFFKSREHFSPKFYIDSETGETVLKSELPFDTEWKQPV